MFIDPIVFIIDPLVAIPPSFVISSGGSVLSRNIGLPGGMDVLVVAHSPYTREVFYDGISVGLYKLDPATGECYGNDH